MANLYVDLAGSDAVTKAANSALNPWATLGRAAWGQVARPALADFITPPGALTAEAANAGDTVFVEGGTYSTLADKSYVWSGTYPTINNGSDGNPITFKASGTVNLTQSAYDSGTVTSATATTVTDTAKSWDTTGDTELRRTVILFTSGALSGESYWISSNTAADTLLINTTDGNFSSTPQAGDTYEIYCCGAVVSSRLTDTLARNYVEWYGDTASDWFVVSDKYYIAVEKGVLIAAGGATGWRFSNFDITQHPYIRFADNASCVRVEYAVDLTVKNNKFGNFNGNGLSSDNIAAIITYSLNGGIIEHNELHDLRCGIHIKGIVDQGGPGGIQDGIIIRYNKIYNIGTNGGGIGLYLRNFADMRTGSYVAASTNPSYAHDNLIYDAGTTDVNAIYLDGGGRVNKITVANNTAASTRKLFGGGIGTLASAVSLYNNLFYGPAGNSQGFGVGSTAIADWDAAVTSDYNLIYNVQYYGAIGLANRTALADWQAAVATDDNSLHENPDLTDPANDDYTIQQGVSPCDGAGLVITAIHGAGGTVNIGAYSRDTETIGLDFSSESAGNNIAARHSGVLF